MSPSAHTVPFDVVIVGGSAAGLSTALALGRSRRRVLVVDGGEPRNAPSAHMHGVLGLDGISPAEFLERGRRDLAPYDVTLVTGTVTGASNLGDQGFRVDLADGRSYRGRALLAATGVRDELPAIPGLRQRWGIDVLHCPYCHGWEVREQKIAVLGTSLMSVHSALLFRQLSADVTLVLHGMERPAGEEAAKLDALGVAIVEGPVTELVVSEDFLSGLRLSSDRVLDTQALVVAPKADASSPVLHDLGLRPQPHPMGPEFGTAYAVEPGGRTTVPGLWATGNVADPVATVPKSVADGYFTGAMINTDLVLADATAEHHPGHQGHRGPSDHAAHGFGGDLPMAFDQAFWDARYGLADSVWSGLPNPHLISEVGSPLGLGLDRALDIGAGEGADAIWLAEQGWKVDAVDLSPVALARGRAQAQSMGTQVAGRINWRHTDLLARSPEAGAYDLVAMHFMQLSPADRMPFFDRCVAAVAPGGALLVVAHDSQDMLARGVGPAFATLYYTADEVVQHLGDDWTVEVQEVRDRAGTGHDGTAATFRDVVLLARRAPH